MGENNTVLRNWLADKERFADFVNGTYFKGEQIVRPENLEQMDGETGITLRDKEGRRKNVHRFRDIIMKWSDAMVFVILAIENQEEIHYAMPVRNMLYDSLSYISQMEQIWEEHKKNGEKLSSKEFLSHMKKEDRLYPVITAVFYYGAEEWDVSLDIHGMLYPEYIDGIFGQMKAYIPNYKINLIDAQRLADIERFHTDLQLMLGMIQCREKKEELKTYFKAHQEFFGNLDYKSYEVVRVFLSSKMKLKEIPEKEYSKEGKDMCQALEDIYTEGIEEGLSRGIRQGIDRGISQGEDKMRRLMKQLLLQSRETEIAKAVDDKEYCQKLYEEFHIL